MPTTVTKTVKSSAGDYNSLANWEAAQQGNLTAGGRDEIAQAECHAFEDTGTLTIAGWTTDSTHYIRIYAAQSHGGIWTTSAYRFAPAWYDQCINQQDYTRFEGIQFDAKGISAASAYGSRSINTYNKMGVDRCIFRGNLYTGDGTGALPAGILFSAVVDVDVSNTIFYGFGTYSTASNGFAIQGNYTGPGSRFYNNTAVDCKTGFFADYYSVDMRNCLAQSCTDGFAGAAAAHGSSTNNCSDIASDAPGASPRTGSVTFVNAASRDYHLSGSDTIAKGYGASTGVFTTDIDGDVRSGTWDIGADQTVVSGIAVAGATITSGSQVYLPTVIGPQTITSAFIGNVVPGPAPIAYWPFNEGSGSTAADASGNGRTLTLHAATSWSTSQKMFGAAALTRTLVTAPYGSFSPFFTVGTVQSVSCWVTVASDGAVIGENDVADGFPFISLPNYVGSILGAGDPGFYATGVNFAVGIHHVVVARNGTSYAYYVDGIHIGTSTAGATKVLTVENIGVLGLIGMVDDVRLYNVVLTAPEVAALYLYNPDNAGASVVYAPSVSVPIAQTVLGATIGAVSAPGPAPIAYWPFNEGTGTTAADASGNGHTITKEVNTVWTTTGQKFGAAALAGTATTAYMGSCTAIDLGTVHSISAWVKTNAASGSPSILGDTSFCWLILYPPSGGSFIYYSSGGGDATLINTVDFTSGLHHVVVTRSGVTIKGYVDGVALTPTTYSAVGEPFTVDHIGTLGFRDVLDDLRIYAVELTAGEAAALYAYNPDLVGGATLFTPTVAHGPGTPTVAVPDVFPPGLLVQPLIAPEAAGTFLLLDSFTEHIGAYEPILSRLNDPLADSYPADYYWTIGAPVLPGATIVSTLQVWAPSVVPGAVTILGPTISTLPIPVAYWPFNEGSGTTSADMSGNGHTLTTSSSAWSTATKKFGAAAFKSDNSDETAACAIIDLGTVHSIACWFQRTADGILFFHGASFSWVYVLRDATTHIQYSTAGSDPPEWTAATDISTGLHHLVITRNGAVMTCYLDGTLLGSTTHPSPANPWKCDTVKTSGFTGIIDDARFYAVELTAGQAAALYVYNPDLTGVFAPTVTVGVVTISGATRTAASQLFAPTLIPLVEGMTIGSGVQLFPLTVALTSIGGVIITLEDPLEVTVHAPDLAALRGGVLTLFPAIPQLRVEISPPLVERFIWPMVRPNALSIQAKIGDTGLTWGLELTPLLLEVEAISPLVQGGSLILVPAEGRLRIEAFLGVGSALWVDPGFPGIGQKTVEAEGHIRRTVHVLITSRTVE